ncbi:MAG: hypothetical protein GEU26_15630 [Nitrososphaeraceae archaeon]|nr:hypothetical protein [Nitrososphaeraceae archaeon]
MNESAPTVDPDNCLRFPSCSFNTEAYGLIYSANDLVTIWKKLVANGFPLEEILSLLSIADEPIEIARTIDALESCRFIKGVEGRSADLKKKLSSIVKQKNSTTNKKKEGVLLALTSTTEELRIAYMIAKMGYHLEFRNRKGPDFIIGSEQIVLLEAKSRFNRTHFGGTSGKSAKLTEKGIFSLLCRDSVPLLKRAFSEQNTNIALVNLSHSEYGLILAAHSYANERKFELKKALDDALALSRAGEDAVVLIVESSGGTSESFGLTLPRKTIEGIGGPLGEIENILKKRGKPFDFYDLAHVAEDPIGWMQGIKASAVEHNQ